MSEHTAGASRRRFIKRVGQGLIAASAGGAILNAAARKMAKGRAQQRVPPAPGKKLGYALVGLGSLSMGQLLPAFAKCEKSKVVALVSGHPDKAAALAARYGVATKNIYNYQNYDTIRDNPEVDVIYVVLPNSMHAEYTVRGAQAGKHILCEKPMATSVRDCEQMIAACRKADRKLMIAYRLHYEPFNQRMIEMSRKKELGAPKVILAEAGFPIGDPEQWRLKRQFAGGGSLMDIGIYALNAARYLSGEEPVEVSAIEYTTPGDVRFREVEETINFQLRFPSGVLANCVSSYGAGFNHFRVATDKGWYELEPALSYAGQKMRVHREDRTAEVDITPRDHFAAEMDDFSDRIMNNQATPTPGEEGLKDMRIITSIYEAAKRQ